MHAAYLRALRSAALLARSGCGRCPRRCGRGGMAASPLLSDRSRLWAAGCPTVAPAARLVAGGSFLVCGKGPAPMGWAHDLFWRPETAPDCCGRAVGASDEGDEAVQRLHFLSVVRSQRGGCFSGGAETRLYWYSPTACSASPRRQHAVLGSNTTPSSRVGNRAGTWFFWAGQTAAVGDR